VDPSGRGPDLAQILPLQSLVREWWEALVGWLDHIGGLVGIAIGTLTDQLEELGQTIFSHANYMAVKPIVMAYMSRCQGVHYSVELLGGSLFQLWGHFTGAVCWIPCLCQDWVCGSAWTIGDAGWLTGGSGFGVSGSATLAKIYILNDYCSGSKSVPPDDPFAVGLDVDVSSGAAGVAYTHIVPDASHDWDMWALGTGASAGGTFGGVTPIRGTAHWWKCLGLLP
jgi:hypothetical protein